MAKSFSLQELLESETGELKDLSFEEGLALLEELVEKVEAGALPLDAAIRSYERGSLLIEHLRGQLSGAEEKLKILKAGPPAKKKAT